jgi:hypothetical protein
MRSALTPEDASHVLVEATDLASSGASTTTVQGGGEVNWLWLAPHVGRGCALVIGDLTSSYQDGLSTHFDRIDKVPIASLRQADAGSTAAVLHSRLAYDDASVDCVVSNDLVGEWSPSGNSPLRDPHFGAAIAELRRLLRPGGFLFLSGQNARWHRALLRWGADESHKTGQTGRRRSTLHLGAARAMLAKAGFSETRAYFVEPSVRDAATVLPASRRAALAYERERLPRPNVPLRELWAASGLYELLYPDVFVLAVK